MLLFLYIFQFFHALRTRTQDKLTNNKLILLLIAFNGSLLSRIVSHSMLLTHSYCIICMETHTHTHENAADRDSSAFSTAAAAVLHPSLFFFTRSWLTTS